MMGKSEVVKSGNSERELAKMLSLRIDVVIQRNLEQRRSGGYDLKGLPPFAIEVKRCEKLRLNEWWKQARQQASEDEIPVLFWRQSRKPWQCMVPLSWVSKTEVDGEAIVSFDAFCDLAIALEGLSPATPSG